MKPLSIVKMAMLSVSLFTVLQATAATPTCEDEIKEANAFLSSQGMPPVNNVTDLATTLRNLKNFGRLPDRYITSEEAKRLGWSGSESESLWGVKLTHQKWIGGDKYSHSALPASQPWLSADVDVVKGYRSPKRLIYSLSGQQRFITTDKYQHIVELDPCQ